MAKWTIPDDLIPRSEAVRMAQEARGAALKEAAVMVDQKYIALGRYGLRDAILSLDPDAVRAHDAAIREAEVRGMERAIELCQNRVDILSDQDDLGEWHRGAMLCVEDLEREQAAIRAQGET